MKPKQLLLVVVLALILGGLGVVVSRRHQQSYQTSGSGQGQKVMPGFPLNDVAQVVVREASNEVALVRDGEVWKVRERANYPASYTEVGDFLRKVWDLKSVQTEQVGPSVLGRFQLLEPGSGTNGAVRVVFADGAGKNVGTLLLGKKHLRKGGGGPMGDEGYPDGRFVMDAGKPGIVMLVSETFMEVEPKADRWLNKDFFKVERLKSVAVTHKVATNSWRVYRETEGGELKLADLQGEEKLDTGKASSVGNALSYPSFTDVLPGDAKVEETGLGEPVTARLETFDGFVYDVELAKKPGAGAEENYSLKVRVAANLVRERAAGADEKPEDREKLDKEHKEKLGKLEDKLKAEKLFEAWVYVVSKWTVDPILKERKDLLPDKKDAVAGAAGDGAPPPAGIAAPGDADDSEEEPADGSGK